MNFQMTDGADEGDRHRHEDQMLLAMLPHQMRSVSTAMTRPKKVQAAGTTASHRMLLKIDWRNSRSLSAQTIVREADEVLAGAVVEGQRSDAWRSQDRPGRRQATKSAGPRNSHGRISARRSQVARGRAPDVAVLHGKRPTSRISCSRRNRNRRSRQSPPRPTTQSGKRSADSSSVPPPVPCLS